MFHAEIREGAQVVRQFNLDERSLWLRYLTPLLNGEDFVLEGHDWTPRKIRVTILEGPELATYQLGMGRGWSNAKRVSTDVTQPLLARARELHYAAARGVPTTVGAAADDPATVPGAAALRERLIGRLGAGPVTAAQIEALAQAALPEADQQELRSACQLAVWELLAVGEAQLSERDRDT